LNGKFWNRKNVIIILNGFFSGFSTFYVRCFLQSQKKQHRIGYRNVITKNINKKISFNMINSKLIGTRIVHRQYYRIYYNIIYTKACSKEFLSGTYHENKRVE